jgi:hypothetical protein|tara:strand:- start:516 stop:728 length:213 start_codon:yes stop_codon:yes gene_type:complete
MRVSKKLFPLDKGTEEDDVLHLYDLQRCVLAIAQGLCSNPSIQIDEDFHAQNIAKDSLEIAQELMRLEVK